MTNKSQSQSQKRTRNYATVVYPESAPAAWDDILEKQCIPAFISPLHNEDINPDGEYKKEHYHVIIMFDSIKTAEQAKEVFELIGGVGCEIVQSIRGYARYLCHLDNPDKHQYDRELVRSLSGADYNDIISLVIDKYRAIDEMIDFCEDNEIVSYYHLINYARKERQDWFRILCDNGTLVIKETLKSKSWTIDRNSKQHSDDY